MHCGEAKLKLFKKIRFSKPRLRSSKDANSLEILKEALLQYGIQLSSLDLSKSLSALRMDDIDFLESLQLIEAAYGWKIDKSKLKSSTSIAQLISMIDVARANN